ncbi:GNAT family N-acetyltransferase [Sinomicrobium weinanense]|uniref:GNAT family N-acetyltransferase n=1 Tax=Sinomicrobium weinanense TaxID=2842200 RepID=A0A926Q0J9_9FLAO|nr:GNAT family N-acetyltransferase [Sinomicrobium weinanense]MBC9794873.1 GNAT family N-acetyltransferase [Sinomicrobium weinanense]MBU3125644.1 GNAT family N-acetyltransferase [Sinomicrobium weinanense]
MHLQPTLNNDLIVLRPLRENDFEPLYEVAKDPLIWAQHPCPDRYRKEEYSKFFTDSLKSKGALIIIDKSNDKIIGSTRFKPVKNVENAVEIGWSFLSRNYWGGKYNRSIKMLMMDYAFEFVDDIIFYVGKNNIRSQKAVKKIGGYKITEPQLSYLIKDSTSDWTYRINKKAICK